MTDLAVKYITPITFDCDGEQNWTSFVLDYTQQVRIRAATIYVDASSYNDPDTTGDITLSHDVIDEQGQWLIVAASGAKFFAAGHGGMAHVNFGPNGIPISAGQALALEWAAEGGGTRTFSVTVFFSAT